MPDANDPLDNLTRDLAPELADRIRSAFDAALASAKGKLRYPVDTSDPLANIDNATRDPLEGILSTAEIKEQPGDRPQAAPRRARGRRRRPAPRDPEFSPGLEFLRALRDKTRYNEQLQREGMQSFEEPGSFLRAERERAEGGGYSPAMSFAPPSLESMSSRPRPPAYTEGPMSSTEGFYEATRRSPNPMVRGAGMRYRPR